MTLGTASEAHRTNAAAETRPAGRWSGFLSEQRLHFLCLAACWLAASLFMLAYLDRGWIPHDEGTLAHSAERVLNGELPHRDFDEPYTGGLSYLNAFAFKLFGVNLLALRLAMFGVFLVWVPVLFLIATRIATAPVAAGLTLVAVVWSVPNYPAAMPSWYNLFFATFGLAGLMKYAESSHARWVALAGLAGGASVMIKTTGLFFIGAGLLSLILIEAGRVRVGEAGRLRLDTVIFAVLPVVLAALALIAIGVARREWEDFYQFAVPGLSVVALAAIATGQLVRTGRVTGLPVLVCVFLGCSAIPLVPFIWQYVASGAVPSLYEGLFELPKRRLEFAALLPPRPYGLLLTVLLGYLLLDLRKHQPWKRALQSGTAIAFAVLGLLPATALDVQPFIWQSFVQATPVVIPLLAWRILRSRDGELAQEVRVRWMVVATVAAFCSLVQYPFAAPIYFGYTLPLLLLSMLAFVQHAAVFSHKAWKLLGVFYLVYGAAYVSPMAMAGLTGGFKSDRIALLDVPRGGLRVSASEAEDYKRTIELLQTHASTGTIYAGPDAPELYFLTGLRNPTRAIYDFLVTDSAFYTKLSSDPDSTGISAVALKQHTVHSRNLDDATKARFMLAFPASERSGLFDVRWRPD